MSQLFTELYGRASKTLIYQVNYEIPDFKPTWEKLNHF